MSVIRENLPSINKTNCLLHKTIGMLPTSYLDSLTYEEQLQCLGEKVNELIDFFNNNLDTQLKDYIDLRFSDILMDTTYDEPTETLILFLKKDEKSR